MDTLVDGRGITKVCIAVFVMASALSASPVLAQSKKDVPEDEKHIFMRQFFGKLPSDVPGYTADSKFLASLEQSCAQPPKSTRVASAGGVIFLGIRNLVWVLAPWVFVAITFKEWILVLDG